MDEYRLNPKAREDLEAIWLYSLSEWGENQMEQYIDTLIEAFVLLTQHPKIGVTCNDIRQGYLRYPLTSSPSLSREIPVWLDEAKYLAIFRRFLLPTTHVIRLAGLRSRLPDGTKSILPILWRIRKRILPNRTPYIPQLKEEVLRRISINSHHLPNLLQIALLVVFLDQ